MLSSSYAFKLNGDVIKSSMFMSCKRIGDVFLIELLNNAFICFTIDDENNLCLLGDVILKCEDAVKITMTCMDSMHSRINLGLYSGDLSEPQQGVRLYLEDGLIRRGREVYPEDALHYFAHNRGISAPIGCGVGETWVKRCVDCGIISYDHMLVASFGNDLKFPILRTDWGAQVVKTDVFFSWRDVYDVYVRVWEITATEVRFRVTFILKTGCSIVDNILLNKYGASQAGQTMIMSELTKCLVLGGGSNDIRRKI